MADKRFTDCYHFVQLPNPVGATWEAVVLGLASGPACLASCGPVLVPWLIEMGSPARAGVGRRVWRRATLQLAGFLLARYAGYMLFAAAAWGVGLALPANARSSLLYAIADLLLAACLVVYALGRWRHCARAEKKKDELVTIGAQSSRAWGPVLGFLTGLSLCPPFLMAGLRAAELHSLPLALGFFSLFFLGTAVWFLPFTLLGWVRWKDSIAFVARVTLFMLAAYYGYVGLIALLGRMLHGH